MTAMPRVNFLVVGTQRTGSSAVAEAISLHPKVACGWEWTLRESPRKKVAIAEAALAGDFSVLSPKHQEHMRACNAADKPFLGFRCLFRSSDKWLGHPRFAPAIMIDRLEAFRKWLARNPRIHVVHIVRSDDLAWLKSKTLARATGKYIHAKYPDDLRVSLNIGEARRRVRSKAWVDGRLSMLQLSNPYVHVEYQDFAADNQAVARQICAFLGCNPTELPVHALRLQSQSAASSASISNIDEVRRALDRPATKTL